MIEFIIVLIIFIVFSIYLIKLFASTIFGLIINLAIIWAICLRSYVEIKKENKLRYYLIGLLITALLFLIKLEWFKIKVIWWPTLYIIITFILTQLIILGHKIYKKKKK